MAGRVLDLREPVGQAARRPRGTAARPAAHFLRSGENGLRPQHPVSPVKRPRPAWPRPRLTQANSLPPPWGRPAPPLLVCGRYAFIRPRRVARVTSRAQAFSLAHFNSRGILELQEQPRLRRAAGWVSGCPCPCTPGGLCSFRGLAGSQRSRAGWPGLRWAATTGALLGAAGRRDRVHAAWRRRLIPP